MKGRGRKERRNNSERGKDSVVPPGPLVEEGSPSQKRQDVAIKRRTNDRTSLAVQWLRLHASAAGGVGSIPGWGTKIPHATLPKK